LAADGQSGRFRFPRPMTNRPGLDFSFSGLKTHVRTTLQQIRDEQGAVDAQAAADVALAFEEAVVQTLVIKCRRAMQQTGLERLVIAGGVSANLRLRAHLGAAMENIGARLYYAKPQLCTDNGAMIAYAGWRRLQAGQSEDLQIVTRARWPLEALPALTGDPDAADGRSASVASIIQNR